MTAVSSPVAWDKE